MKNYTIFLAWFCFFTINPSALKAWECDVTVDGPSTIKLNQQVALSATGTPAGGSYSWSRTPNLIPNGSTATLTGFTPTFSEYIRVVGYYTSPKGKKCSDTKWLWACVCSMTDITGPSTAKVGEEITLTTQADPDGGAYTWSIVSGNGTLTPNKSSAKFVGNQKGPVEIKASYVPPEGGEPCEKYHTIELEENCQISLSGDMYQRPVCRPVNFSAQALPAPGECSWNASSGFTKNGCAATYIGNSPGYDTLTATYTRPGGTTCEDSRSILSYLLENTMGPKRMCYASGSSLVIDDFNLTTIPSGFHNNASLSPTSFSTLLSKKEFLISASLLCDQPDTVSTVITIVNKDIKTVEGISFEIPNLFIEPLTKFGLADKIKFELRNTYEKHTECCETGPLDFRNGNTSLRVIADFAGKTLYGVPLPPAAKKYITLDLLQGSLSGRGDVKVEGKYLGCQATAPSWSGGGSIFVRLELNAEAKVKDPRLYILLQGKVGGRTDISENLMVNGEKLDATGKWGGIKAAGTIKVQVFGRNIFPTFLINRTLMAAKETPPFTINLPSL